MEKSKLNFIIPSPAARAPGEYRFNQTRDQNNINNDNHYHHQQMYDMEISYFCVKIQEEKNYIKWGIFPGPSTTRTHVILVQTNTNNSSFFFFFFPRDLDALSGLRLEREETYTHSALFPRSNKNTFVGFLPGIPLITSKIGEPVSFHKGYGRRECWRKRKTLFLWAWEIVNSSLFQSSRQTVAELETWEHRRAQDKKKEMPNENKSEPIGILDAVDRSTIGLTRPWQRNLEGKPCSCEHWEIVNSSRFPVSPCETK